MNTRKILVLMITALLLGLSGVAYGQAEYPEELAKIVAAYPGANILASHEADQEINAIMMAQDDDKTVIQYYLDKVVDAGWKKKEKTAIGNTTALTFTKDNQELVVAVAGVAGSCQITLALTQN